MINSGLRRFSELLRATFGIKYILVKNKGSNQLDKLVEMVRESSKYRKVDREFIKSIGSQELAKRRKLKDAIKDTKNKHNIELAIPT